MMRDSDSRGQVYTLEAILAVLLLGSVILFIIPSFTIPAGSHEAAEIESEKEMMQDADELLQAHADEGHVKDDILNYDDTNDQWESGAAGFGSRHIVTYPDSDFGDAVAAFEDRHDVIVTVYLSPSPDQSNEDSGSDRVLFMTSGDGDRTVGVVTETITLYNDDQLMASHHLHSRRGSAYPADYGEGPALASTTNFPIDEADTSDPGTVYNTVEVQFVIEKDEN